MNKESKSLATTVNEQEDVKRIMQVLENYPKPINKLILYKTIILVKYKNEMSEYEINSIREFEFTINQQKDIISHFEYWTNSKRTKGYTILNIEEMKINVIDLI